MSTLRYTPAEMAREAIMGKANRAGLELAAFYDGRCTEAHAQRWADRLRDEIDRQLRAAYQRGFAEAAAREAA